MHPLTRGYSTKQRRKLLRCGSNGLGGSSCELCGLFRVDEFSDSGDLDVVPGAERKDENRFVVEFDATGKVAVQPRLYDETKMLVMHEHAVNRRTYVNPDVPGSFTQSEDFVLWQDMITARVGWMHDMTYLQGGVTQ